MKHNLRFYLYILVLQFALNVSTQAASCYEAMSQILESNEPNPIYSKVISNTSKKGNTLNLKGEYKVEEIKGVEDLFEFDNLVMSTAHSSSLREQIENLGDNFRFKNTFEVDHKSNADASIEARMDIEAYRMGLSAKEYKQLKDSEKPVYGYLQFKKGLKENQSSYLKTQYGDDIWVFKADEVVESTTYTVGDSMSYKGKNGLLQMSMEDRYSLGEDFKNTSEDLDEYFLGFNKYKNRLQNYYMEQINSSGFRQKPLYNRDNAAKPNYFWSDWNSTSDHELENYIELQFFPTKDVPLSLANIKEFVFTKEPPSESFLRFLNERGIKVKDWRIEQDNPIDYISELDGGPSLHDVNVKIFNKKYLESLRKSYYVRTTDEKQLQAIVDSMDMTDSKERQEFLISMGVDYYDAKQVTKMSVPTFN